jgi:hypothetical protein
MTEEVDDGVEMDLLKHVMRIGGGWNWLRIMSSGRP